MPTTNIERGRPITPAEFDTGRHVAIARLRHGRPAVRRDRSDRQDDHASPACTSASSASRPRRARIFGQSQDEFAVVPLGAFQRMFGSRRSLAAHGQADATRRWSGAAMDETTVALRIERRLRPKEPDNFGVRLVRHLSQYLQRSATSLIFAVLIGVVGLSLVVGGIVIMNIMLMVGQRTDARDRAAQVARRAAARHPLADSHRIDHALDIRRRRRHRLGLRRRRTSSAC